MKIHYDPETGALWIELRDAEPVSSLDYEPGVTAALDANGLVIALEILDVREHMTEEHLSALATAHH
jgi:uncharacterized protein YuzE